MNKGLLLIDIQNDYFKGGKSELFKAEEALLNAKKILNYFRSNKLPVIHVKHINVREGATFFLPDTFGAEIHEELMPLDNEHVVVKNYPNSFYKTDLIDIIEEININELIICGMMTHMCVDTTVRSAKDFELLITLIEDACTTKDLIFNGETIPAKTVHNTFMASLDKSFANVVKASDFL